MLGQRCPEIDGLEMLKGERIDIPSSGAVVCVECWATWCGPCRQMFPHMSELARKYRARGFKVIGVTQEPMSANLKQFVASQGNNMDYSVAVDGDGDVQEKLMMPAGARGIPHAFLIDSQGIIRFSGHPAEPAFESTIENLCRALEASKPSLELTQEALSAVSVKDLKKEMQKYGISYAGMSEKQELIQALLKHKK